jgi:putative oxidoreductase
MALMIGSAELLSGVLVLIGLLTRPAAIFQIIILIGAMVMFGFDFTTGPAIWKDPTLLGVSIMLLLYGSGKFGLDYLITKKKANHLEQL